MQNNTSIIQSFSSNEASFDSGVRSPDIFSDDDQNALSSVEPLSNILRNYETYEKKKIRRIEETLHGVLPPPWVTMLKIDASDILKKYYSFLPLFDTGAKIDTTCTPAKNVSLVDLPAKLENCDTTIKVENASSQINTDKQLNENNIQDKYTNCDLEDQEKSKDVTTYNSKILMSEGLETESLKMSSKHFSAAEAKETPWPDILKCRFFDVYYNSTKYSEKLEMLCLRFGERYIGGETDTSVCVHSGGLHSPASAAKAKALRLKMAQIKSPGRRLSHLARRRQTFCSAATIGEKAQSSSSKMVLIDKNFFPHKKLVNLLEKKSPRRKPTGSNTPSRSTPGKKSTLTPSTRSGGSSRKKAMRRLLLDSDPTSRSQPKRETLKRALFMSPENKPIEPVATSSVPLQAMRSKRMLFGSPDTENKLKRKLDMSEDPESSRCKIPKSLSFGGDSIASNEDRSFTRRASELIRTKPVADLNELHKKKLLWAVSEALRGHGYRMSTPGFRERAAALARLTRRLLALPPHAALLARPNVSTSDTMLKLARQYAFRIIQNGSIEDCFQEEKKRMETEKNKLSGYISAVDYQQLKAKQLTTAKQIKENICINSTQDPSKSCSKSVLQEKSTNSSDNLVKNNSTSKIDSMLSCEEIAKLRVRRQISFDDVDLSKR